MEANVRCLHSAKWCTLTTERWLNPHVGGTWVWASLFSFSPRIEYAMQYSFRLNVLYRIILTILYNFPTFPTIVCTFISQIILLSLKYWLNWRSMVFYIVICYIFSIKQNKIEAFVELLIHHSPFGWVRSLDAHVHSHVCPTILHTTDYQSLPAHYTF